MSHAVFKIPEIKNEPMLNYAPGSTERVALEKALADMKAAGTTEVPLVIAGRKVKSTNVLEQRMPHDHQTVLCRYYGAEETQVKEAIEAALAVRDSWANLAWADRAAIFLKAADLLTKKYRYEVMAATMLGQGKNAWQAEIDAAAELADFLRFNVKYAEQLYATQPPENTPGCWNRTEYRPLEGFVYAVAPFNFTAIAGNLVAVPVLMGNVVVLKPSPSATLSNYLVRNILIEAGVPENVIQFVPGDAEMITKTVLAHKDFAGLHFTGSTHVFKSLWKQIADNLAQDVYRSYPKIVGETGGKNFHFVHPTAHIGNAVLQSVRGAFEYQGQKCSALSRLYCSRSVWDGGFKDQFAKEVGGLKVGPVDDFTCFNGPVIHQASFDKLTKVIDSVASDPALTLVAGGKYDDSRGYFIHPTVVVSTDPHHEVFSKEYFGPFVAVYVYEDDQVDETVRLVDTETDYALTGAIFAQDRLVVSDLARRLVNAAGNFYINEKCTGAVVGQQPFGGARASGTNDKAGSASILSRFVSPRSIKDNFVNLENAYYPSNSV
ncbi:Delta-1-pyrroline-5-carboxylate dehydrogenase [Taphrina deformans PYCC 5710]|uniref:Multifunctional fusion protein n=1 Tax=Taphrina deformans (strain PYCC 5710 / ATCC 11124 / CBS 356.35 / IMI 108563 / JCM 9778 / NBRC 8474) TaxID=1097556 RepID=R4X8E1_TAPDE|nr:Delta-1-pyrroline-5-carboxylate dehydrogenase [Taphrina deformans PYCC 5710]|eukprot:CCG81561.1 Delta-1-pyrroline-5-carboxylate dehydrogenase [Taphrina deformans PYCC 5710]